MASSSNDALMSAVPAITGTGGASGTALTTAGTDTGATVRYMGQISLWDDYRTLKEWALNYKASEERASALAKAQMQHMVGALGQAKNECTELRNEMTTAKTIIQSEIATAKAQAEAKDIGIAQWRSETHAVQSTNAQILKEYTDAHRRLELAEQQLTHLADMGNKAALAYEFKDNELKRAAFENEKLIQEMNIRANADREELEKRLQLSGAQCQEVINKSTESQEQAQARIEAILAEHQREKGHGSDADARIHTKGCS